MIAADCQPSADSFAQSWQQGKSQLVWSRLVLDLETPVSAMLKLTRGGGPSFLLESVEGGEVRGRYSIIGLMPDYVWRCFGNRSEISHASIPTDDSFESCWEDSLTTLRKLVTEAQLDVPPQLPPMAGGLIGYMSYDMVKLMERLPDTNPDPLAIPDACFMRPRIMIIFDARDGVAYVITPAWHAEHDSAEKAYHAACERIAGVVRDLQGPADQRHYFKPGSASPVQFSSQLSREAYGEMVEKAKSYIASGDIYQIVLSQRFSAPFNLPAFSLYRSLRFLNPSPFLFYLNFGEMALVGSSPEILVRLRDETVTIRPIAGTRPRGKTPEEDARLAADLLADPKELAEHLMLLDLGRNDVGRVAKPGSVKVTEHMTIEHYSHVMHIVSNVEGKIAEGHDAIDALIAGFPAGTVSGAPKIRAMEIIEELEPLRRSFYAGCVGYFSANGSMDTCIALRTGLVKNGTLTIQSGGGVVADSTAEGEYQESLNKAKAMMRAAELAGQFA